MYRRFLRKGWQEALVIQRLTPENARRLRQKIDKKINRLGRTHFDFDQRCFDLKGVHKIDFLMASTLQYLGLYGYKISLSVSKNLEELLSEHLLLILKISTLEKIRILGPLKKGGLRKAITQDEGDQIYWEKGEVDYIKGECLYWREVEKNQLRDLTTVFHTRTNPLELDITGQAICPEQFSILLNISTLKVTDKNRCRDEDTASSWFSSLPEHSRFFDFKTRMGFLRDMEECDPEIASLKAGLFYKGTTRDDYLQSSEGNFPFVRHW